MVVIERKLAYNTVVKTQSANENHGIAYTRHGYHLAEVGNTGRRGTLKDRTHGQ